MNVFIISSVRNASEQERKDFEEYVDGLEASGATVHLPHRDTKQEQAGIAICCDNRGAIEAADEVHIFYSPDSQGTHFDMGVAFALRKPIRVVTCPEYGPGKSYPRMLHEWQELGPNV